MKILEKLEQKTADKEEIIETLTEEREELRQLNASTTPSSSVNLQ